MLDSTKDCTCPDTVLDLIEFDQWTDRYLKINEIIAHDFLWVHGYPVDDLIILLGIIRPVSPLCKDLECTQTLMEILEKVKILFLTKQAPPPLSPYLNMNLSSTNT